MGNKSPVEEEIKKEFGGSVVVEHKLAFPFTVVSEVNGTKGKRECLPMYYNCPGCIAKKLCGSSIQNTAKAAKAIGGAPQTAEMQR